LVLSRLESEQRAYCHPAKRYLHIPQNNEERVGAQRLQRDAIVHSGTCQLCTEKCGSIKLLSQSSPDYPGALKEALNARAIAQRTYLTATEERALSPFTVQIELAISVALIAIVVLYAAKRRKKKVPTVVPFPPPQSQLKYCVNCGKTLSLKAEFCEHKWHKTKLK